MKIKIPFEPAGHRILVLPIKAETKTESGLYLAPETIDRNQIETVRGKIIAVGKTAWKDYSDGEPWAKVGDTVLFAKFAGALSQEDGEIYRVINDEDVIGVYKED